MPTSDRLNAAAAERQAQQVRFAARAKSLPIHWLRYALKDIRESLDLYRSAPESPYSNKLWMEWDTYQSELQKREAR